MLHRDEIGAGRQYSKEEGMVFPLTINSSVTNMMSQIPLHRSLPLPFIANDNENLNVVPTRVLVARFVC